DMYHRSSHAAVYTFGARSGFHSDSRGSYEPVLTKPCGEPMRSAESRLNTASPGDGLLRAAGLRLGPHAEQQGRRTFQREHERSVPEGAPAAGRSETNGLRLPRRDAAFATLHADRHRAVAPPVFA